MGRPPLMMKRTHISFTKESLARLDALVGKKGRAEFVRMALDQALDTAEATQRMVVKGGRKPE
ncbi:hypothetical protein [Phenylobacterium sp.]|uniref:hypothetical protein n=1 Tax=Phenylobacterium sp. TaxID=1871053 RepID=UPI00272AD10C|nr:hypothetical protein [Phenylobacterium sp.]